MFKPPDDVIATHHPEEKEIQGEGGGTHITVAEDESSEQSGLGAICGIVEVAIAIDHEDEHVSISQIGA